MDLAGLLDIGHALLVRLFSGGMASPAEALAKLDEILALPPRPERESWGMDPAAQRAQSAMLERVGGPAPMRREERDG